MKSIFQSWYKFNIESTLSQTSFNKFSRLMLNVYVKVLFFFNDIYDFKSFILSSKFFLSLSTNFIALAYFFWFLNIRSFNSMSWLGGYKSHAFFIFIFAIPHILVWLLKITGSSDGNDALQKGQNTFSIILLFFFVNTLFIFFLKDSSPPIIYFNYF